MKTLTWADFAEHKPCYNPAEKYGEWEGTILDLMQHPSIPAKDKIWAFTRKGINDNKTLRLFAVACARQVQHLMKDQRSIDALNVGERYANGEATEDELDAAWAAASAAARYAASDAAGYAAGAAAGAAASDAAWAAASEAAWTAAAAAAGAGTAAYDAVMDAARAAASDAAGYAASSAAWDAASAAEKAAASATQVEIAIELLTL